MAAGVERRAACGASYNACASGATPCKFETRQPARPAGKARADRQFQRRVSQLEGDLLAAILQLPVMSLFLIELLQNLREIFSRQGNRRNKHQNATWDTSFKRLKH